MGRIDPSTLSGPTKAAWLAAKEQELGRRGIAASITEGAARTTDPGTELAKRLSAPVKPPMNRTETELYSILRARGYDKVIFEAITMEIGNGARYCPDFFCVLSDKYNIRAVTGDIPASFTFFECKGGFIREASLVRLKVAARTYPWFKFILAQKKKGTWTEKRIEP